MREKIIKYLKNHPGKSFKKRQLSGYLRVKKSKYTNFRQELKELVNDGQILRMRGGYYTLNEKPNTITGKLICKQKGFGFVLVEDGDDIYINNRNLMGAIHGDTVEVNQFSKMYGPGPEGKIIRIVNRGTNQFIGSVYFLNKTPYLQIEPVTPKRNIRIVNTKDIKLKESDIIKAKVLDWGGDKNAIIAKTVQVIGSLENPDNDMNLICSQFDLMLEFPDNVIEEERRFNDQTISDEIKNRKDLRKLKCITIDPEDARDFDDAVSLEYDRAGNAVLGVHIADVGHFVHPGSTLDSEARKRGTSVYFAEGVVHMLPEKLSTELCSLKPDVDRLAVSAFMTLNSAAEVIKSSFSTSVIRNHRRFTYSEVQSILDGDTKSDYRDMLVKLKSVTEKLLKNRQELGSIDFDIPEPIFKFSGSGIPHEIIPSERLDSHRIVEECMLLANRVVAREVPVANGENLPFIYRVHDKPPKADIEKFLEILRRFHLYEGQKSDISPADFRNLLSGVEDSPYKGLIERMALRTMTKAIYSTENRGHYGLAFNHYTHFTSPIRRYPDLVIHRLLKNYIIDKSQNRFKISTEKMSKIAVLSTNAEIEAMEAERDYIKLKQIRWLSQHIGEKFEGIISGIIRTGIFVELKDTMVEGFVQVDSLEDDYYVYDEMDFSFVGKRYHKKYQLSNEINVIVKSVSLEKRQANFLIGD